jgi:hypothetical protein
MIVHQYTDFDFRALEKKCASLERRVELLANTTRIQAGRADAWEEKFHKETEYSRSLQNKLRESCFSARVRRVFKALYESIWTDHYL